MRLPSRTLVWLSGALLLGAACSGSVVVPPSDGGTTSSAGGSSTGGHGGQGGGTATCPQDAPTEGTACDLGGQWLACTYPDHPGECCAPLTMYCQSGYWRHQHIDCWPLCALSTAPTEGAPCCPYADPPACELNVCGSGATYTDYGCNYQTGKWEVTTAACPDCGGASCKTGEVCVETGGGAGISYHCEANPCAAGQPMDCGCAAALCPGSPYTCDVSGGMVRCECATCP